MKNTRWFRYPQIELVFNTLLSIIGGIVLSNLFSAWFSSLLMPYEKRLIPIALVLIITLALLSIALLIGYAKRNDERAEEWLHTIGRPSALHFEKIVSGSGTYYKVLAEALESVGKDDKIWIQTWHGTLSPPNESDKRQDARERYLELLIEKAKQPGVEYQRILCFDPRPDGTVAGIGDGVIPYGCVSPWLAEHCQALIKLRREYGDRISVRAARTKIRADIVVIPGRIGCVVFDLYDDRDKAESALFIFHAPPNREIVEKLGSWFKEINRADDTRAVKAFQLSSGSSSPEATSPSGQPI